MKRAILLVMMVMVASCGTSPVSSPTPTTAPVCKGDVCIRRVFLGLENNTIFVEFDLVDSAGEVEFGDEPQFEGEITVGLFLEDDGEDTYLWGARLPSGAYVCYSGNDMPWSEGQLASSCGFAASVTQMQVKPQVGDAIRVEIIEFDFAQTVVLEEKEE